MLDWSVEMSEKENGKVSKAGIGYTIGNYLIRGLGFLTLPIFARLLSAADYGAYNTYVAYESILFIFVGMALHTSFKNARLKFSNEFNEYISSCILLLFLNTACFLFLGNTIIGCLGFSNHTYVTILILHSFSTAIIGYYNSYLSIYYRSQSYVKISLFNAVANIMLSVILIVTVFKENRSDGRIIGIFLPSFFIAVGIVHYFWKQSKPKISGKYWEYALKYSLPLIPHGISQVLLSSFDRVMIQNMIGKSEAGIYSFSYNIYAIIFVTYSSLDQVWSQWFYEKMNERQTKEIRECANKYLFGMSLFTMGVMLISPEIVFFMGTKEYYDSVNLLVPVILGGFFSYMYGFPAIVEYYYEKTKYIAIGTMGAAAINIILNYVCIREYGYVAAAYTTLATYLLYFIFHYILSIRVNNGSIYDFKYFLFIMFLVICNGVFVQCLMSLMWLRWLLGFVVGIILLFFLDRQFYLRDYIQNKFRY